MSSDGLVDVDQSIDIQADEPAADSQVYQIAYTVPDPFQWPNGAQGDYEGILTPTTEREKIDAVEAENREVGVKG